MQFLDFENPFASTESGESNTTFVPAISAQILATSAIDATEFSFEILYISPLFPAYKSSNKALTTSTT